MTEPTSAFSGLMAEYRQAAAKGVLVLPHCRCCDAWQWPPRAACTRCGGSLEWRPSAGNGRLVTWSVVTRAPREELRSEVPYVVAFVELDEGIRLFTRITGRDAEALKTGMRVRCGFRAAPDSAASIPVFLVAEG